MGQVYLVDDDPIDRMLMRTAFRSAWPGLTLMEFEDGESAIEAVRRARPRVTLLDVRMPRFDGFQTLEGMRALDMEDHPIVMVSSSMQSSELKRAKEEGASAYFGKPDTLHGYQSLVRSIGETWFARNASP